MTMKETTIRIRGMSCGGCVRTVREALGRVPGVRVDAVAVGAATVSYDPDVTDHEDILAAIARAGYAPQAT